MPVKRFLITTAAVMLASTAAFASPVAAEAPHNPETPAKTGEQTDKTASDLPGKAEIEALLTAFDVPGLAIATLTGCSVDGGAGYGLANLETGAPVTAETAFEAASLSKPVFAYLVMQLVDEGVIDLDQPIAGAFPYPRIRDQEAYGKITPRMVLVHRTGLPNWVGDSDDLDRDDPLAFKTPPGSAYAYSGEAFEMLRAFVEQETGKSLDALFKEHLGAVMPNSTFAPPLPDGAAPSRAYRSARDPESGRGLTNLQDRGGAAGGLVTTANDYARFVSRVCSGAGLSPASHAAMLEAQSPAPADEYPAPTSWALGWGVMSLGPETIVFHGGNNDEYRSLAGFLPETGEGFVFLANGRNGGDMINAIIEDLQ